jgi:hypothetical protein
MFIHEISHVAQALNTGGLIMKDGVLGTHLIHEGANERTSYRAEYSYDPQALPDLPRHYTDINEKYVANIKYPDGSYIYPEWHDAYEEWEKQLPNQ